MMRCLVVAVAVLVALAGVSAQFYDVPESNPDHPVDEVSICVHNVTVLVGEQFEQLKQHIQTQVQLVKKQVDAVKNKVDRVEGGVGQVKNDVDTVKVTVNALKAGVNHVEEVRVQMDAVKVHVNAVNDKVDAVKAGVDKIEDIRHRVEEVQSGLIPGVKSEVVQVKGEVHDLRDTVASVQTQLDNVATIDSLINLNVRLTKEISDLKRDTLAALQALAQNDNLATILEDVMSTQLLELMQIITKTREECGHAQSVAHLLDQATTTNHRLESLGHQLNSTHHTLASSCSQGCEDLRHTLIHQTQTRCDAAAALDGNLAKLQDTVDNVGGKVDLVVTYTKPPPPSPAPTQTQSGSGEMNECLDSTFVKHWDSPDFNVCQAIVRYRKCRLPLVAYHCCSSCTSSGQIPTVGPWRFYTYSRNVTHSQVISLMGK